MSDAERILVIFLVIMTFFAGMGLGGCATFCRMVPAAHKGVGE